jgi:hypothetical protein
MVIYSGPEDRWEGKGYKMDAGLGCKICRAICMTGQTGEGCSRERMWRNMNRSRLNMAGEAGLLGSEKRIIAELHQEWCTGAGASDDDGVGYSQSEMASFNRYQTSTLRLHVCDSWRSI